MKKFLVASLLLGATSLFACVAHAGEIEVFEHADFGGRAVALREVTPSFSRFGFNDRSSSIVVRSGRWEVCSDDDFNGFCAVLERGEYPRLDPRLNDRISSAREVDRRDGRGPQYDRDERRDDRREDRRDERRNDAGADVVLFSENGLRGRSVQVGGTVATLVDAGFNDAAVSMVIRRGSWELCSDRDFRGECRVFGPGQYGNLGPLSRQLTSLRRVD